MQVLLVSPQMEAPSGGIAVWTDAYLNECSNHGIECKLVNTAVIGARAKNGNANRNYFDEFLRTGYIFKSLKKTLKKSTFDIAHVNTSCGILGIIRDYLIVKEIRRRKIKVALHFHCDIPFQIKGRIGKYFLSKIVQISDKNLVLCESSRQYLKTEFGIESIKVPNSLNEKLIAKKFKTVRPRIEKAFFVGRVERNKGAAEIYELARRLPNIRFELAGDVSETVAQWAKSDNVFLLGRLTHDDIFSKMDDADVFLFPTHSEGFSIALLESMARGLPIITTDVGANADMIESHGGVVLECGDVNGMEAAFSLLDNKEIREKASKWCVHKVQRTYTSTAMMKYLKAVYLDGEKTT